MRRESRFHVKRWKLLLNLATVIAVAFTIYAVRGDISSTYHNIFHVNVLILLLIIPLELLDYHAQTKLYQHLFKIVGNKLTYKYLFFASVELNFVNHVFPSGGAAGISYFGLKIKNQEITTGKATFIQVMKLGLTFVSFEVLILLSALLLALGGKVNSFALIATGSLTVVLIIGSGLFIYIIGKRERINSFFGYITRKLNQLLSLIRPSHDDAINMAKARKLFDDFHFTYNELTQKKHQVIGPLFYAFLANVAEIAVLYVVFIAFGRLVNVGAVILAYGIANFAGTISIIPGGIGIYEALMTGAFLATGISPKLSLPVIIMYRVLNTILQVPPGYYLYQKNISRDRSLNNQTSTQ